MPKTNRTVVSPNFLFGIIVVLLITIVFLTYKLYTQTLQQASFSSKASGVFTITVPLPDSSLSKTPEGSLLTSSQLGYTVIVPEGWVAREYQSLAGAAVQPYEDIIFLSPDFAETNASPTDGNISEGASIFIRGLDTIYKTIEDRYANNVVAKKVATNITRRTLNGNPIIQYEYELTGENVTNATLIKNGKWYLIKFQYADSAAKVRYESAFEQVLSSFNPK
ncbi:MAG: hypothetical protein Q8Q49_05830 [bacterium]|nr:hypothetical protein [bacterium]